MLRRSASFRLLLCVAAAVCWARPGNAQTVPGAGAETQGGVLVSPMVTIYTGTAITDEMIGEREFGQLRAVRGGYIASPDAIVGKVARRTLLPGYAIPVNAVGNAKLVRKGEPVRLVFEEGGLTISTLVTPLQDGELNERIRVRNVDSGLVVHGVVQEDATLRAGGDGQ